MVLTYSWLKRVTALWIVLLVAGSLSPVEVKVTAGTETKSGVLSLKREAAQRHRLGHLLTFGVAGFLVASVARRWGSRGAACIALMGLGCLLEWVQYEYMGSQKLEVWDMRDDGIGVLCGLALAAATRYGDRVRAASR